MKILALTSIRSDYDLMSSVYKALDESNFCEFGIIVAGVNTSDYHGKSITHICNDKLNIVAKVSNFHLYGRLSDQLTAGSELLLSLPKIIMEFNPDLILVVGDREDALMFAISATYLKVPFVHFFGGDLTVGGHIDNQVRNAISKLATFHFVSHKSHFDRLIRIGESSERIRVVGNPSIDNFRNTLELDRKTLFKELFKNKISENNKICFFLYHPFDEEFGDIETILRYLIKFLEKREMFLVVGQPNNDRGFKEIYKTILMFRNNPRVVILDSLNRELFINLIRNTEIIIGNSSMGILESSTFKVPVINLGDRQKGRLSSNNVISSDFKIINLEKALNICFSSDFRSSIQNTQNLYEIANSTDLVVNLIKSTEFSSYLSKSNDPLDIEELM